MFSKHPVYTWGLATKTRTSNIFTDKAKLSIFGAPLYSLINNINYDVTKYVFAINQNNFFKFFRQTVVN